MSAALDRIMFGIVLRAALAIDALREWLDGLDARLPSWAQNQDNRLLAYLTVSCVVCTAALVIL